MTNDISKLLNAYAERIEDLRPDILFDDPDIREPFDRSEGMAVQFFLAGLAQLDTAHRMMKLAALQWEQEQEQEQER